jgi:cytochrome c oxidase subunit 2
MGVQANATEDGYDLDDVPTLYLPVNKTVQIELRSRDVIHSFWIIDFLYKKDMYLGRENFWSFTPTREGTYEGKCAELCGEYHSAMLFNVKVVSEAEYEDYLDSLRAAGDVGDISDLSRLQNLSTGTEGNE